MLTLEQVRQCLNDRNLARVAEGSGLHYQTVYRVAKGIGPQVSYEVVKKLSDYFQTSP